MTDGLVTTDGEGLVADANPMALQLLGCEESDIVGRPLGLAVDVRGPDGDAVLDTAGPVEAPDAVLHRPDGSELAVRVSVAALVEQPGQVVVISDRTREREIERMKTEFLSNVSHELRTPLTPIRGYAELLARRPDLPRAKVQGFVAEILAGTARLHRAVELLVDVAALEAGRVSLVRNPTDVAEFVDERTAEWSARYPERAGDFRRRVASRLPMVEIDPAWLSKALDELADNAVKYTATGRSITLLAAANDSGGVRIAVRDTGPGIDTERLGELLGDFSQADASETRHVGGMGLGLGFVTRVAAQLGLELHVSSTSRGAEFAFDLPASTTSGPRQRRTTPPRSQKPSVRRSAKSAARRR
jgi:signal transduction histidine kinase